MQFSGFLFSAAGILLLCGCWIVRLIAHISLNGERRRNFLVAPACGLVLIGLLSLDAPLKARWELSESAFNRVVAGFGWFPDGPDPAALNSSGFERPEFTHLDGPLVHVDRKLVTSRRPRPAAAGIGQRLDNGVTSVHPRQ